MPPKSEIGPLKSKLLYLTRGELALSAQIAYTLSGLGQLTDKYERLEQIPPVAFFSQMHTQFNNPEVLNTIFMSTALITMIPQVMGMWQYYINESPKNWYHLALSHASCAIALIGVVTNELTF